MDIPRDYRFEQNPDEKEIVEQFIATFGSINSYGNNELGRFTDVALTEQMRSEGNYYLTKREEKIILNTIQWLKTPVGKFFMNEVEQQINNNNK